MAMALVIMSASLIAAVPATAAKSNPQPAAELEVYVMAEGSGVNSGIANALVSISDETGRPVTKDLTDENGTCLFNLTAGTYIVDANADGYYNSKVIVEVNAGGPTRVLKIVLQQNNPAPTYRTLAVLVTDGVVWGKGIPGAQVVVYTPDGDIRAQGLTDALGYFKPVLLPGAYALAVSAEGYIPMRVPAEVGTDPTTDISVILRAQTPQLLTLFAVGAEGKLGLVGVSVGIYNSHGLLVTKGLTDDRGYFKPMLLPGFYNVIASAAKYQTTTMKVEVTDTRDNSAVIVLQPVIYRPLQVLVVRGDQDMGIPKASVTVLNLDNIIQAQGWTDKEGYYQPTLPIGSYIVIVNGSGYDQAKVKVEVTQVPMTKLMVMLYPTTHQPTK